MDSKSDYIKERINEDAGYKTVRTITIILYTVMIVTFFILFPRIEELSERFAQWLELQEKIDDDFGDYTIGFVCFILLAIIGRCLIAYIASKKQEYKEEYYSYKYLRENRSSADYCNWTCRCGTVNEPKYIYCKSCNTKRNAYKNNGIATPFAQKSDVWECECGKKDCEGNFCSNCGNKKKNKKIETTQTSEWICSNCGRVNHETVGTCGCGQRKP